MNSVFSKRVFHFLKGLAVFAVCGLFASCGGAPASSDSGTTSIPDSAAITLSYISASTRDLVRAGQGGVETSIVTFEVKNSVTGEKIAGRDVVFSLEPDASGVELSGGTSASTGSDGRVSTILQSGSVSTSVRVKASIAELNLEAESEDISIATGAIIAGRLSFILVFDGSGGADPVPVPSPSNPNELPVVYESASLSGVTATLQVTALDRFNNPVRDGIRLSFWSSSHGSVASNCELVNGLCQVQWSSNGAVADYTVATVLVHGSGTEDFVDLNGNNIFDSASESWVDIGEAYVDENSNGQYDVSEQFLDTNGNGVYDVGGDSIWNGAETGYTNVWETLSFMRIDAAAPDAAE